MANSHFVARRIRKIYGREAWVIPPPVVTPASCPQIPKQRFFLTASRLVPYKNVHVIVDAFRLLPEETLIVAGDGPELPRLRTRAGPNVRFVGFLPDGELRQLMAAARAFVFAAEEDFGIVAVEAQAQGTPVLALGRGGARETVITDAVSRTGLFFDRPEPDCIAATVRQFTANEASFLPQICHYNARRFSEARFEAALLQFVGEQQAQFGRNIEHSRAKALTVTAEDAAWLATSSVAAV